MNYIRSFNESLSYKKSLDDIKNIVSLEKYKIDCVFSDSDFEDFDERTIKLVKSNFLDSDNDPLFSVSNTSLQYLSCSYYLTNCVQFVLYISYKLLTEDLASSKFYKYCYFSYLVYCSKKMIFYYVFLSASYNLYISY